MSILSNIKKNGFKYITPQRGWLWFRSLIRKVTGYRLNEKDSIIFSEIVTYKSLTCPDCVELGHCRICECPVNELFTAMEAPCSDGKFPSFKKNRQWKLFFKGVIKGKIYWKYIKKPKHWRESWKKYKQDNKIDLIKIYS